MLKDPLASWHVGGVDVQDVLMDLSKDGNASEMQNPLSDVDTLLNKPASTPYSGLNIYDSTEMYDVVNSSNSIPKCQDSTLLRRPQGSKERLQQIHPIQSSFVKIESKVANIQSAPELIKLLRNHETKVPSKQAIVNHIIGTDISQKVQSTSSCHLVPVQAIPVKTHPAQCPPVQSLPVQADQSVPSVSVPSVSVPCVSVQSGLVQSVPVQTLPLQSPQILISPHRTSSVQLCSLLPKHTEEQGSAAVVALPR